MEKEQALKVKAKEFVSEIAQTEIITKSDYDEANDLAKRLKGLQSEVTEYWEPLRKSTYEAYSTVNKKKKEMLDPLKESEKIIKEKMSTFLIEEKKREEAEAEKQRKAAMAEAEKIMADAINCDGVEAELAMLDADMMMAQAENISSNFEKAKSTTRDWRIKSINASKVPDEMAGFILKVVDEKEVMNLIKKSNGTVNIPGVEYEETFNIRIR